MEAMLPAPKAAAGSAKTARITRPRSRPWNRKLIIVVDVQLKLERFDDRIDGLKNYEERKSKFR